MYNKTVPDSKVHVANMEPTWVLAAPGGPHVGPMNLAIRGVYFMGYKSYKYNNTVHILWHILYVSSSQLPIDCITYGTLGFHHRTRFLYIDAERTEKAWLLMGVDKINAVLFRKYRMGYNSAYLKQDTVMHIGLHVCVGSWSLTSGNTNLAVRF